MHGRGTVNLAILSLSLSSSQEAVARGLELEMSRRDTPECFFNSTVSALDAKRTKMEKWLREANLSPMVPEGGYFMLARIDDKGQSN